jgi:hypothetical protein
MNKNDLLKKINSYPYWYHKIDLGNGVVTPGLQLDALWNNLRKTRDKINYKGKRVLDICSFDGMFAFEAEKLGAKEVVATDCLYRSQENFLLCREILKSEKTKLFYNVSPYNLVDRLDVFFGEDYGKLKQFLLPESLVYVKAKVQNRYGNPDEWELKPTSMQFLADMAEKMTKQLTVKMRLFNVIFLYT